MDPRVNFQNIPVKHNPFWLKLNSFYLPTKRTKRYKRNLLSLEQKARTINRVIQTVNPDVIISFQQEATFILKGILKLDVPVITMFHGKPQLFFEEEFFEQYKQSLEDCECCQILMPEYYEELTRFFKPQKVELIPNVVPQYTAGALLQEPTIIHIGRISPEKRQHLIVEAFSLLKDKYPEWNVEIWGETNCAPNYTNRVTQLISDNALTDRIRFCGSTNNIEEKLSKGAIFIFPSKNEGFPLALTEAMSKGLPAIGCQSCSAVNSLIRNGHNGFLCSDDPEDIAEKLELLMKDRVLRKQLGENAREDMKEYSADKIWGKWVNLIESVIAKK